MTKSELIHRVARKLPGTTKREVEFVINTMWDTMSHALKVSGDRVEMGGFGTFNVTERKAREGRNPNTGDAVHIPAN